MGINIIMLVLITILAVSAEKLGLNTIFWGQSFKYMCLGAISIHILILMKRYTSLVKRVVLSLSAMILILTIILYGETIKLKFAELFVEYLIITGIIIVYLYLEKVYKRREYNSFLLKTKLWRKRSNNFKWNYLDLHKFAPRSSCIVLFINFGIIGLSYNSMHIDDITKILFFAVILDILCGISYLVAIDRHNDYLQFFHEGKVKRDILKMISTQFSWMISRGIAIGIISLFIMDKAIRNLEINYISATIVSIFAAALYMFILLITNYLYLNKVKQCE